MNRGKIIINLSVVILIMMMVCSCAVERDPYLRTLSLDVEYLEASDSINIEQYDLFQIDEVVSVDEEWLLVSSNKMDYRLLFVNTVTGDHFYTIRKGRGPGEMLDGGSLHKSGDDAVFYCLKTATCIRLNLDKTVVEREAVYDTIGLFRRGPSKPVYMTSLSSGCFLSCNLADPNVWYSLYDRDGNIMSSVAALGFEELSNDRDDRVSFHASSKYAAHSSGMKVCVANVCSASLSFSKLESGVLSEYRRIEIPPDGMVESRLQQDYISAFHGLAADDDHVYVLYSGNRIWDRKIPVNECRHLIVYNWDGTPIRHFYLDHTITSVHVLGDVIYGTSTYPESCVYKFQLPDM